MTAHFPALVADGGRETGNSGFSPIRARLEKNIETPASLQPSATAPISHVSSRRIWRYRVDDRPARVIDPTGADRDVILRELVARYGAGRVSDLQEVGHERPTH